MKRRGPTTPGGSKVLFSRPVLVPRLVLLTPELLVDSVRELNAWTCHVVPLCDHRASQSFDLTVRTGVSLFHSAADWLIQTVTLSVSCSLIGGWPVVR